MLFFLSFSFLFLIAQAKLVRTEAPCIDPENPLSPASHAIFPQVSDATRALICITLTEDL